MGGGAAPRPALGGAMSAPPNLQQATPLRHYPQWRSSPAHRWQRPRPPAQNHARYWTDHAHLHRTTPTIILTTPTVQTKLGIRQATPIPTQTTPTLRAGHAHLPQDTPTSPQTKPAIQPSPAPCLTPRPLRAPPTFSPWQPGAGRKSRAGAGPGGGNGLRGRGKEGGCGQWEGGWGEGGGVWGWGQLGWGHLGWGRRRGAMQVDTRV